MLQSIVQKNRSYRRFHQNESVNEEILKELIDLARITPSAANKQPLKYVISYTQDRNELIFPFLSWAGYLADWPGPVEGERPSAYIIILGDTTISKEVVWDHGIAAQTILLGAAEKGYGGCIIGQIRKDGLRNSLNIPERYEIILVLALGKPKERVVLEEMELDGDIKYWRDDKGVHHVPKRGLNDIIVDI